MLSAKSIIVAAFRLRSSLMMLVASADAVAEVLESSIDEAKIPMMTITINNSTNVKPLRVFTTITVSIKIYLIT
jgi:hypothetical protein